MRIISGSARGRTLLTLPGLDTRPTLDRVRESVFGSLQFDIPGCTFLDVFSGSGAMGLEAASRGAKHVVCNDLSAEAVSVIRRNVELLRLGDTVDVRQSDYRDLIAYLTDREERFDFVYLDPPYASGFAQDAAERIFRADLLKKNGTVLAEHATEDAPFPGIPRLMYPVRTRKYGKCSVTEYRKEC